MAPAIASVHHRRAKPGAKSGATGGGRFFHVEVRPAKEFVGFRVELFGSGFKRVAGRRADGSWATATWLIGKDHAHLADGRLVTDSDAADRLLTRLASAPVHIGGDRFRARSPRRIARRAGSPAVRRATEPDAVPQA